LLTVNWELASLRPTYRQDYLEYLELGLMGQSLRQCNTILEVRKKALGNFSEQREHSTNFSEHSKQIAKTS